MNKDDTRESPKVHSECPVHTLASALKAGPQYPYQSTLLLAMDVTQQSTIEQLLLSIRSVT